MRDERSSAWRSFLHGYASAFDLWGRGFDRPDYTRGPERDRESWARDWANVGRDIRVAMGKNGHEK